MVTRIEQYYNQHLYYKRGFTTLHAYDNKINLYLDHTDQHASYIIIIIACLPRQQTKWQGHCTLEPINIQ